MSDAHDATHDAPHEGPIKTPKQLVWAVVASFVVPIIVIMMLTQFVASGNKTAEGTDAMEAEAVARRIHPVASVEIKDVSDIASMKTGDQVYAAVCSACHAAGTLGSPKFGDEAAWAPRVKTGYEALLTSALKGKGSMAAQGGGDFSDYEIGRAVVYMANKSGAKFDEPKAPVTASAAAASAAQ
jgi:cytochrome c5